MRKMKDKVVISVSVPRPLLEDFDKLVDEYGGKIGVGVNRSAVIGMAMLALIMDAQEKKNIQKEENNQIMQLQQQLEEAQQQLQQLQGELQKSQQKVQQLDEQRLKLEQEKIQLDYQVNWFKAQTDRTFRDRQMSVEEKRTEIEIAQLRDGNPYNDQVRNM